MDYSKTLHLPETEFPMRGNLPKKEPGFVEFWQQNHLYEKRIEKRKKEGAPTFVLHDGPPYANGKIHIGHALNKTLKDIIVRYHHMAGNEAIYVPGWDTHGLPIEYAVLKDSGEDRANMTPLELRRKCLAYAKKWIEIQKEDFIRMGVVGDFAHRYVTFDPHLEAKELEVFGEMANKGYIYKGKKAVYWCTHCETALAEAEIEYKDRKSPSIYVKYPMIDVHGLQPEGVDPSKVFAVIWTTTPWTIPASCYISVNPKFTYVWVHNKAADEYYLMNKELAPASLSDCKVEDYEFVGREMLGSELDLAKFEHPLAHFAPETYGDRTIYVLEGNHVTLDAGTGCVHTAPGHGVEDFEVCVNHYPQVPVIVPVDDGGYLTEEAGKEFAGLKVWAANKVILEHIKQSGHLMGVQHITHQYPHCWRCHHPIIFRATEQWFCSIDKFREEAYKAIDEVKWQPAWGHDRMHGMVRDRSDWCISRQRVWGVPIPVFYCKNCGKYHITDASIKAVSDLFRKEGSDAWYKYDANEIMPKTEVCECGASDWEKDPDIMDVWFDSGSTWSAVCRERPELNWPADLYMEGADQFRGWFQSSLLTSVATQGVAPYKGVLCHGWVVDEQGKQMHKSAGNGVEPSEIIRDYGADIVRLWVASSDYTVDVRAGKNIFKQLSEAYRKMRNTARFMLGNIGDFNPATDMVAEDQLFEIDRWALKSCNSLTANVRAAYDNYDFSRAYHAIYNFCVIDMSNFYMDVIKDRLYCADEHARRCAQTALYRILVDFTKLVAPILCFTAQEIWSYIPKLEGMQEYVCWERMPEAKSDEDAAFDAKWAKIIAVRDDVKKVLEQARADKTIGSSLEAAVTLYCSDEMYDFLNAIPMDELADLMIVSHVDLVKGEGGVRGLTEGLGMSVAHAAGNKCLRCWKFDTAVGEDGLCPRCAKVLG